MFFHITISFLIHWISERNLIHIENYVIFVTEQGGKAQAYLRQGKWVFVVWYVGSVLGLVGTKFIPWKGPKLQWGREDREDLDEGLDMLERGIPRRRWCGGTVLYSWSVLLGFMDAKQYLTWCEHAAGSYRICVGAKEENGAVSHCLTPGYLKISRFIAALTCCFFL